MKAPSRTDRVVKVSAYLTDESFGYEHWRAAQFSAPTRDSFGLLLLFDHEAGRDLAYTYSKIVIAAVEGISRAPEDT